MSKRKRVTPTADDSADDATAKEDMVHVTPDLLAGSPDIFAGKKTDQPAAAAATAQAEEDAGASAETAVEQTEASTTHPTDGIAEETPAAFAPAAAPSVTQPAPFVNAVPYPPQRRRIGASAALGTVLIVLGVFALVVVVAGVDLTQYGWPLFVIIPGLTLLVAGFTSFGSGATIPGGVVTILGLVLAYQNSTGDWPSWAYAWALIVPGGIGLGMYLQALRDRDQHALRTGRTLMFVGFMIFAIGFVLFESILGISGRDYGVVGRAALPALLIVIGVILLVRSVQRARRA